MNRGANYENITKKVESCTYIDLNKWTDITDNIYASSNGVAVGH